MPPESRISHSSKRREHVMYTRAGLVGFLTVGILVGSLASTAAVLAQEGQTQLRHHHGRIVSINNNSITIRATSSPSKWASCRDIPNSDEEFSNRSQYPSSAWRERRANRGSRSSERWRGSGDRILGQHGRDHYDPAAECRFRACSRRCNAATAINRCPVSIRQCGGSSRKRSPIR